MAKDGLVRFVGDRGVVVEAIMEGSTDCVRSLFR